jgi:thioredoxin 1
MKEILAEELFERQNNNEKIMLDIYADWCGPCKMLSPILDSLPKDNDIHFLKMDFEKNKDYVTTLGIKSIPTVIFFNGKDEFMRMIGVRSANEYNNIIEKLKN